MPTARQAAFRARQTTEHIAAARADLAAKAASAPESTSAQAAGPANSTGNCTVGSVLLKGIGVTPTEAA